ncbi:hypothetical protein GGF41_000184 [Coemansia sp. RSA 2531]|nr:hypothetical protein GGF41_000184 [Coemansia sp. RSA 2531]
MFKGIKNKGTLKGNFPEKCIPYQLYPSGSEKKKLYHYGKLYTSRLYAVKVYHLDSNRFCMLLSDGEVGDITHKYEKANSLFKLDQEDYEARSLCVEEGIELYMNDQTDLRVGGKALNLDSITREGYTIANIIVSFGLLVGESRVGCIAETVKIFCNKRSEQEPFSLIPSLNLIPVLTQQDDEHNGIDLITFRSKTLEQKFKPKPNSNLSPLTACFSQLCHSPNNRTLEYGLVRIKREGVRVIVKLKEEFDPELHVLCGIEESSSDNGVHLDSNHAHHYAIVLTFDSNKYDTTLPTPDNIATLQEIVAEYFSERGLDVRGLWYDNSKSNNNVHFNLHVANKLPLEFFRVDFDLWNRNFGKADVEYCYNPILWRIYASRNEVMRKGLPYVCKYIVFGHFTKRASELGTSKRGVHEMADYPLIHEEYLQDDIVSYQYRNHCLICFERSGEEIQELRDVINTPARDLHSVLKETKVSLKYELIKKLQKQISELRDEKVEWVQNHEKERVGSYPGEVVINMLASLSI